MGTRRCRQKTLAIFRSGPIGLKKTFIHCLKNVWTQFVNERHTLICVLNLSFRFLQVQNFPESLGKKRWKVSTSGVDVGFLPNPWRQPIIKSWQLIDAFLGNQIYRLKTVFRSSRNFHQAPCIKEREQQKTRNTGSSSQQGECDSQKRQSFRHILANQAKTHIPLFYVKYSWQYFDNLPRK